MIRVGHNNRANVSYTSEYVGLIFSRIMCNFLGKCWLIDWVVDSDQIKHFMCIPVANECECTLLNA